MPDPIIHEYHYPGGPPTLEYMLGEKIPAEHANRLSPFVRDMANLPPETIKERLAARWSNLDSTIKPIATHLLAMDVCSVIFTGLESPSSPSWLAFRNAAGAQWMLGAPPESIEETLTETWINNHAGLKSLVTEFGDLQVGMIPPCTGFYIGRIVREDDQELCWGKTGSWENSLPIYHDGSGNSVCVSPNNEIGIWSPDCFNSIATSLAEFVGMFIAKETSRESPASQWWW